MDQEYTRKKREDEEARKKILQHIEEDRKEKGMKSMKKEKTPADTIREIILGMIVLAEPWVVKICLQTVRVYLNNLHGNPSEERFRKINLQNEHFRNRVGSCKGGLALLKEAGFEDNGELFLVLKESPSVPKLKEIIDTLDEQINKMPAYVG